MRGFDRQLWGNEIGKLNVASGSGAARRVELKQTLSTWPGAPWPSDCCQQRSRQSSPRSSKVRYIGTHGRSDGAQRPTGISLVLSSGWPM